MTTRQGQDTGRGSGYRNLRAFPRDSYIHKQSAYGMKQPQLRVGMTIISKYNQDKGKVIKLNPFIVKYKHDGTLHQKFSNPKFWKKEEMPELTSQRGKDMPVKEVEQVLEDVKQKDKQEIKEEIKENYAILENVEKKAEKKPSKVFSNLKKFGAAAVEKGKEEVAKYKEAQVVKAEKRREKYVEELRDIDHPLVKKYDKVEQEIADIEQRLDSNPDDSDRLRDKLYRLEDEEHDLKEQLKDIDLGTFTDTQLKSIAIREKGDTNFFSTETSNKYERELLRRIQYRKELDRKIKDAEHKGAEPKKGLFE